MNICCPNISRCSHKILCWFGSKIPYMQGIELPNSSLKSLSEGSTEALPPRIRIK